MSDASEGGPPRRVAIACQGGASHTAFTAGALSAFLHDYARQPARDPGDRYQIIGLSGTSGGAICAFLAWYGLISAGPARAAELLDDFWREGIAAKTLLEEVVLQDGGLLLLRSPWGPVLQTLGGLMGAPYLFNPQMVMDTWATCHIGPLGDLIAPRPEHVNVEKLFRRCDPRGQPLVDQSRLDTIGAVQRGLQQISRVLSEIRVLPDSARATAARLDLARQIAGQVRADLVPDVIAPGLHAAICDQLDALNGWRADDPQLLAGRRRLVQPLPTLMLGAVDVLSGAFKAFDSRRGEISIQAVLASTILPELFQARRIGNQEYWDGLFAQNPPLRNFAALPDDPDEKPDEIWLVKINPTERLDLPAEPAEIVDRRNELSGDLALGQEIQAIETVNQWLDKLSAASRGKYKHIDIARVQLDEAAVGRFAGGAKMYRGREFVRALIAHGGDQARAFLPLARQRARLRRLMERGWDEPTAFAADHTLWMGSNATDEITGGATLSGPAGLRQYFAGLCDDALHDLGHTPADGPALSLDDLIVEAISDPGAPAGFLAACRWSLRATSDAGPPRTVKIQGTWVCRSAGAQIVESWIWDTRAISPPARWPAPPDGASEACRKPARALVRHWLSAGWLGGDLSLVEACFAGDYVHHDYGYFPEICGRAEYKAWLQGARRHDLRVERLFGAGDRVVAVLRWADDQRGVIIYRVAGGAIQESWATWDTRRLLREGAL